MKPYEKFVENMLKAVREGQGKDPAAATALIHETLRNAGLMPGGAQSGAHASARPPFAAPFADLKDAPAWGRAAMPEGGVPFADWRARFDELRQRQRPATPDAPGTFL